MARVGGNARQESMKVIDGHPVLRWCKIMSAARQGNTSAVCTLQVLGLVIQGVSEISQNLRQTGRIFSVLEARDPTPHKTTYLYKRRRLRLHWLIEGALSSMCTQPENRLNPGGGSWCGDAGSFADTTAGMLDERTHGREVQNKMAGGVARA